MKLARPILRLSCKLVFGAFASSKTSPKTILGLPLAKGLRYRLQDRVLNDHYKTVVFN
jgi:hypothetical protein